MQLQRQHSLLSYFKTLSVDPAGVELTTSRVTNQLSYRCAVAKVLNFLVRPLSWHTKCLLPVSVRGTKPSRA